jgi:hypothetical protein
MLRLKSLDTFENSPWTSLEQTLKNIPTEKHLQVAVHPNSVLFQNEQKMEVELRWIAEKCEGRSWNLNTSGLTPILGSVLEYIDQINLWLSVTQRVLEGRRHPVVERSLREGEHHFHSLY